jgi:hypothetical protein
MGGIFFSTLMEDPLLFDSCEVFDSIARELGPNNMQNPNKNKNHLFIILIMLIILSFTALCIKGGLFIFKHKHDLKYLCKDFIKLYTNIAFRRISTTLRTVFRICEPSDFLISEYINHARFK